MVLCQARLTGSTIMSITTASSHLKTYVRNWSNWNRWTCSGEWYFDWDISKAKSGECSVVLQKAWGCGGNHNGGAGVLGQAMMTGWPVVKVTKCAYHAG
jgi:hypothetical protein